MRNKLASKYMTGIGAEMGGGHAPWLNPNQAKVIYVDRYTRDELWPQFPVESRETIPETDILADGFTITPHFFPGPLDFVMNSHILEHTPRPAEALDYWLRLVKVGGYVVGAVPNKDHTFDKPRELTSWYDLTQSDLPKFKERQYRDWYSTIDKLKDEALDARVKDAIAADDHIHFAVWDCDSFTSFIHKYADTRPGVELVETFPEGAEMFFVLKRTQ